MRWGVRPDVTVQCEVILLLIDPATNPGPAKGLSGPDPRTKQTRIGSKKGKGKKKEKRRGKQSSIVSDWCVFVSYTYDLAQVSGRPRHNVFVGFI